MAEERTGKLYGIEHSNREGENLWGKNQFNSTFPLALACYMRDKGIPVIYLTLDKNLNVVPVELSVDDLFGTKKSSDDLYFSFETRFDPYAKLTYDPVERVDLVIAEKAISKGKVVAGKHIKPLEVKLTVVPDQTTHKKKENAWSPELVIRPATTMYCALGTALSCADKLEDIKAIFEPICHSVMHWNNETEVSKLLPDAINGLDEFQQDFFKFQQPTILQPIWRTEGKKPVLAQNAFDIFVWSDFALARVYIELARRGKTQSVSRHARSALRLTRFLFDYSRSGKVHLHNIYADMTYSYQSDKEFSISGQVTHPYMKHERLEKPVLSRDVVKEIILDGGEKNLSPERRFDQTIYFSSQT